MGSWIFTMDAVAGCWMLNVMCAQAKRNPHYLTKRENAEWANGGLTLRLYHWTQTHRISAFQPPIYFAAEKRTDATAHNSNIYHYKPWKITIEKKRRENEHLTRKKNPGLRRIKLLLTSTKYTSKYLVIFIILERPIKNYRTKHFMHLLWIMYKCIVHELYVESQRVQYECGINMIQTNSYR